MQIKKCILSITILSLALLFGSQSASAQFMDNRFKIGGHVGLNVASLSEGYSSRLRYQIALTVDYGFTDNFYVTSGIGVSTKGGKKKTMNPTFLEDMGLEGSNAKAVVNPVYLNIPIHLACKFSVGYNTRLFFHTGPYLAIGMGGKTQVKYRNDKGIKSTLEWDYFGKHRASRFDMGLGIGGGVELGSLVIGIGYDFGLKSIKQIDGDKSKNRNFEMTFGFKI